MDLCPDCGSAHLWPLRKDELMQRYVVGFAFDTWGRVALIRKNRPAWQAGRLNGIGGHVEEGETYLDAMSREWEEETGTKQEEWDLFATMAFPEAVIYFFRILNLDPKDLIRTRTTTDEGIIVWNAESVLRKDCVVGPLVPNLSWLIPLAQYTGDNYEPIHIKASIAEAYT